MVLHMHQLTGTHQVTYVWSFFVLFLHPCFLFVCSFLCISSSNTFTYSTVLTRYPSFQCFCMQNQILRMTPIVYHCCLNILVPPFLSVCYLVPPFSSLQKEKHYHFISKKISAGSKPPMSRFCDLWMRLLLAQLAMPTSCLKYSPEHMI